MDRRTKVIATLGPASIGQVNQLVEAGVDAFRINCAHIAASKTKDWVKLVRAAEKKFAKPLSIIYDIQGPKIRLDQSTKERFLKIDEKVSFSDKSSLCLSLNRPFSIFWQEGTECIIGDGLPRLRVINSQGDCIVIEEGYLAPNKGVTFVGQEALMGDKLWSEKDLKDIKSACELGGDFLALSWIDKPEHIHEIRKLLPKKHPPRLIAKIEKPSAYKNLAPLAALSDALMIARGDYGLSAGLEEVPLFQQDMLKFGAEQGKLTITATQMLESMLEKPKPTRAEVADIAGAVFAGTGAVMLSGETSIGKYPLESVKQMVTIIKSAEKSQLKNRYDLVDKEHLSQNEAIMNGAVTLARLCQARALIVPTESGETARSASHYRPTQSIIAICQKIEVARSLALEWGIKPLLYPKSFIDFHDQLNDLLFKVAEIEGLPLTSKVVITAGAHPGKEGSTSMISLREIQDI